jgi:hypothetical protein
MSWSRFAVSRENCWMRRGRASALGKEATTALAEPRLSSLGCCLALFPLRLDPDEIREPAGNVIGREEADSFDRAASNAWANPVAAVFASFLADAVEDTIGAWDATGIAAGGIVTAAQRAVQEPLKGSSLFNRMRRVIWVLGF